MQELLLKLNEIGINTYSSLQRFNFNHDLYLRLINKFLHDESFKMLEKAVMNNDKPQALIYASSLQGITSNLGFELLELKCKKICILIHNNIDIKPMFFSLKNEYYKTIIQLLIIFRGGINERFNHLS